MIRREIHLFERPPQWLLISQVEHARVSGVLAEHCLGHFPQAIRSALQQAIIHHDDGWAAWEEAPQLDGSGRPYSFRELPLEVSLPIWTASIDAAAEIGAIAEWIVARHFLALLGNSDKEMPQAAQTWQAEFRTRSASRLTQWQAASPSAHTLEVAEEGLKWLQLFDVMSLWLCSACPVEGESVVDAPESYHIAAGQPLETEFSFESNRPRIHPWRFDVPQLRIEADGWTVPVGTFASTEELLEQREPYKVCWQLHADG